MTVSVSYADEVLRTMERLTLEAEAARKAKRKAKRAKRKGKATRCPPGRAQG